MVFVKICFDLAEPSNFFYKSLTTSNFNAWFPYLQSRQRDIAGGEAAKAEFERDEAIMSRRAPFSDFTNVAREAEDEKKALRHRNARLEQILDSYDRASGKLAACLQKTAGSPEPAVSATLPGSGEQVASAATLPKTAALAASMSATTLAESPQPGAKCGGSWDAEKPASSGARNLPAEAPRPHVEEDPHRLAGCLMELLQRSPRSEGQVHIP